MRRPHRVLAATGLAGLVVGALLTGPAGAAPRPLLSKAGPYKVADGVSYTKFTDSASPFASNRPLKYYVVEFTPSSPATLDVAMAGTSLGRYAPTSTQAQNDGAVAAINGDFTNNGQPVHPFLEDGDLRESGFSNGGSFAIRKDETLSRIDQGRANIDGKNLGDASRFIVNRFNDGDPKAGEIGGYSQFGGGLQRPPLDACNARLQPSSGFRWSAGKGAIVRSYTVQLNVCQHDRLSFGSLPNGSVILSANRGTTIASTITNMKFGKTINLTWKIDDWTGVADSVGGAPVLVKDGINVASDSCGTYFCDRNPRAGIGFTSSGHVLLVVVDGRSSSSVGITPRNFAALFKSLNATNALNLDGGGGATMWVKGRGVVNVPSDGSERPVTNTVQILPGPDHSEPSTLLPQRRLPLASASEAAAAQQAALADPASTGGLADYLVSRARLRGHAGPSELLAAARAFRSTR